MLQLNQINIENSENTFPSIRRVTELSNSHLEANDIYPELAKLSLQKQWILYTADCPRPVQSELTQHSINTQKIIHMKPSTLFSEEEIVVKAIQAGTASAVVASASLSFHTRAKINVIANIKGCAVFFLNENSVPSRLCH